MPLFIAIIGPLVDEGTGDEKKATELAKLFIANFNQFCDSENGKNLVKFGPQV